MDGGSRPYGRSIRSGKPGAVPSVSPGNLVAFGANHIQWQSIVFLDAPMMQQPEAYLNNPGTLFDENGKLNGRRKQFLKEYIKAYVKWADCFY